MRQCLIILLLVLLTGSFATRHRKRERRSHKLRSRRQKEDSSGSSSSKHSSGSTIFPSSFQPLKRRDPTLIHLITRYMEKLYPSGPVEEASLRSLLLNEDNEAPFRASSLAINWYPVECRFLDLELRKVSTIHEGRRNQVLKMYDLKSKRYYAWKRYENVDEYTSELAFYMVADHPNIIKAICTQRCQRTGYSGILMEFAEGGSSMAFAKKHADKPEKLLRLTAQTYDVLKYMHWLGFIHADFKPENVMVDERGNALVIDFGFTTYIPYSRSRRGTPTTMAPEVVEATKGPLHENVDTWALGSTIAQLWGAAYGMTGRKGRDSRHKWVPIRMSTTYGYSFGGLPKKFSRKLRQLMYYTMHPIPGMRMLHTESQLRWFESLPFWKGIDFETVGVNWNSLLVTSSFEGESF